MTNPMTYLSSWQANHGWYSPRFSVHPACSECGRLYPDMRYEPAIWNISPSDYTTECCGVSSCDWLFVTGSRKRINLHKQRDEILAKRGIWTSLCR